MNSVYSSLFSLRSLRLSIFVGEFNNMESWAIDIGTTYLEAEAKAKDKVYIVGGLEFESLKDILF